MALMASTRREADDQSFPLLIYVLAPALALGLQSYVPLHLPIFAMLDLPLMVVIYFAMARRSPMGATIGGALMGLAQDALTHQPLGVFGIAKAVVGYVAASLGVRIDTESHGTRLLLTFLFIMLHNAIDLGAGAASACPAAGLELGARAAARGDQCLDCGGAVCAARPGQVGGMNLPKHQIRCKLNAC